MTWWKLCKIAICHAVSFFPFLTFLWVSVVTGIVSREWSQSRDGHHFLTLMASFQTFQQTWCLLWRPPKYSPKTHVFLNTVMCALHSHSLSLRFSHCRVDDDVLEEVRKSFYYYCWHPVRDKHSTGHFHNCSSSNNTLETIEDCNHGAPSSATIFDICFVDPSLPIDTRPDGASVLIESMDHNTTA